MGELSVLVLEGSMPERYSTLILGTYESSRHQLCLVNAGHVPPMLIRGGQVVRLEAGGLPAGLLPDSRYDSNQLTIEPGDLLVCVSDGVSEAMNHQEGRTPSSRLPSTPQPAPTRQQQLPNA